jgi:hypothetical protein
MAIQWKWDDKIGEAVIQQTIGDEIKEYTKSIYDGNCFMIFLNEWKNERDMNMYSLYTFFADEKHAKICLGLTKGYDGTQSNIFDGGLDKLLKLRINKKKARNYKKIVTMFAQAFDNLTIEIYTEDNK